LLTGNVSDRTSLSQAQTAARPDDEATYSNARGIEMEISVELRLERVGPAGEPAAMVATWLISELPEFPGIGVRFTDPHVITLELASPVDRDRLRARVAELLEEPRFVEWEVRDC
jgi:hypothetical protein